MAAREQLYVLNNVCTFITNPNHAPGEAAKTVMKFRSKSRQVLGDLKFVEEGFESLVGKKKTRQEKSGFNSIPLLSGDMAPVRKFRDVCAARMLRISARAS